MWQEYRTIPIAIVGMACRLPGADNADEYWRLLTEGRSACGPVPEERFNRRLYYNPKKGVVGRSYSDLAALIDYSRIRPEITGLSGEEIRRSDIAHLAFCQTAVESVLSAGYRRDALRGKNYGVYVGHTAGSALSADITLGIHFPQQAELLYDADGLARFSAEQKARVVRKLIQAVQERCPKRTADYNPDILAGQVHLITARALGLTGPAMAFNSACASSLQALAHAVKSIQLGRIEGAIVGGASCFTSDTLVLFSAARSLTATGSAPFTSDADGLVVGEGCVSLVLKRLDRALTDGDTILGVIASVGVSSDGSGKSLWAPRKEGQIESITRAYENGTDKSLLQYVEAHATSTRLGDVIELQSLQTVFGDTLAGKKIPIGSVKRNIGHTLEVAGLSGLAKLLLALKYGVIPAAVEPQRRLNPDVRWDEISFYPPRENLSWPKRSDGLPRRAAVEAFGIGGLNVHVVVDGFDAAGANLASLRQIYPGLNRVFRPEDGLAASSDGGERVAVVGVGTILPDANGWGEFRERLGDRKDHRRPVPKDRWDTELFASPDRNGGMTIPMPEAGAVDFQYDWKKHKIPPKQLKQGSPLQFMMLETVDQGLRPDGGSEKLTGTERTGCVVGSMFAGDFGTQLTLGLKLPMTLELLGELLRAEGATEEEIARCSESFKKATFERFPALLDETGSFTSSALASRITKSFNLMGGGVAVDAGYESSGAALLCCLDMLQTGDNDRMIFVAGQQDFTAENFQMLRLAGCLAPHRGSASPLSAAASGIVPGEGCAALVLKRLEDARRDGDPIYGIIQGIGVCGASLDAGRTVRSAVIEALRRAQIDLSDIRAVEITGTGHVANDRSDLRLLNDYFSGTFRSAAVPLATRTGEFGLLGGGSGALSLLAALSELDRQEAAPNFGIAETEPVTGPLRPNTEPVRLETSNPRGRLFMGVHLGHHAGVVYHLILERGTTVIPVIPKQVPYTESLMNQQTAFGAGPAVIYFDATRRRLEKKRQQATGIRPAHESIQPASPIVEPPKINPIPVEKVAIQAPSQAAAPAEPSTFAAPSTPAAPVAPAAPAANAPSREELEAFLVNFVVEQTGYPKEVVELDADLEGDLGIDSIKKGQLFGELGEYFDITPDENQTLDDFPTLRSVLNFLSKNLGAPQTPAVPAAAPAEPSTFAAPSTPAAPVAPAAPAANAPSREELEAFLVNFVVEQTGYPKEVVELDADLEGDLGIDSIKKGQLFGELGEYFDITPDENQTLDDFPTLRSVLNFLSKNLGAPQTPAVPAAAPAEPSTFAAPSAPAAPVAPAAPAANAPSREELEAFLVNFVVEQTGYPKEVVELDADLEGDLGIDSIKKGQLFGELGEYFDITPDENQTLDDFPTLRSVLNFLSKNLGR